jgi:small-conductance mechanosensitive channel/CRP-like cAMP-binding protein
VTFFDELAAYARAGHVVGMTALWLVVVALVRRLAPAARRRLRPATVLLAAAVVLVVAGAGLSSAGYDDRGVAVAALACELLAVVGLVQVAAFEVVLPRVGVTVPRILVDIATGVASLIVLIIVGKRAGWSVAGLITTSAVLTAVIGFAMQDTLGNLVGGLALQADSSIKVGDWIALGPGGPSGRVSEIRWRYTAIETRAWETVIVPNSVLMKGQVIVQGRRTGEPVQLRRAFELYVDFRTPPTEVVAAILRELSTDPVANMAIEPPPQVLFTGIRDSYAVYTVRYWLTDLAVDEITDSAVRIRAYFALRRAGIPLSIPAQALFVTAETEDRRARKADEEQGRRLAALAAVDLFTPLGADERATLAAALRPEPFAAGETVTHEGEPGLGLYLITRGRAVVQLGTGERARQVAELGAGQFFGEMSLMTGAARSATVVAATDLECYRIDKDVFQTLILARPEIADQIAEVLAARREALESARGQRAATSRADVKADLVDRIRGFFGLRG